MKYTLTRDWPCRGGALTVPAGTTLEWEPDPQMANATGLPIAPKWRGETLPTQMPIDAKALDQQSANALADLYPYHNHLLQTANGIKPKRSFNI